MVGCCLVDRLYKNVSFTPPVFLHYLSKKRGDGGLMPGKLVFKEVFEEFYNEELPDFLMKCSNIKGPDKMNIGGPGIVPLIHTSQLLCSIENECLFY